MCVLRDGGICGICDLLYSAHCLESFNKLKTNSTRFTYATSQSLELEMLESIGFDSFLMSTTFVLITVLAIILMSIRTTWITSPGLLLPVIVFFF